MSTERTLPYLRKRWIYLQLTRSILLLLFLLFDTILVWAAWNTWLTTEPLSLPRISFDVAMQLIVIVMALIAPWVLFLVTQIDKSNLEGYQR